MLTLWPRAISSGPPGLTLEPLAEPTDTETQKTLDAFTDTIAEMLRETKNDPTIAQNAPCTNRWDGWTRRRRRSGRSFASRCSA